MGRLQEYMDRPDFDGGGDLPEDRFNPESELEQQKQTDLARAQARSVARPIKKERRHSQVEGRYIRPEEVKKEIAKLERAKREAAEKKKGFFSRLFGNKKEEPLPAETAQPEKKEEKQGPESTLSLAEKNKKRRRSESYAVLPRKTMMPATVLLTRMICSRITRKTRNRSPLFPKKRKSIPAGPLFPLPNP